MNILARVIAILGFAASALMAHEDPFGEIRPRFVMIEGRLEVLFHVSALGRDTQHMIAPLLKGFLGTAIKISETKVAELRPVSPPGTWIERDGATFVFGAESNGLPCIFRLHENRPSLIMPRWGKEKGYWGNALSFAVTDKHFLFLVGKGSDRSLGFQDLHLYVFDRESLELAHHLHVGDADGILQEPTYSPLVVVGNTVFFCWSKRNEKKPPSLVMTELSASGKLREHTIRKEFHWNAVVDIAATADGVFVVHDLPDSGNANSKIHIYRHHEGEHVGGGQPTIRPDSK